MLNPEIAARIPMSLRDDIEERVAQLRADPTCFDHLFTDEAWDEAAPWYAPEPAVTEPTIEPSPVPHTEPEGE